jgi:hypothetical protein
VFTSQAWQHFNVKDTQKGPKVVEVKHAIVYPQNEHGLPAKFSSSAGGARRSE